MIQITPSAITELSHMLEAQKAAAGSGLRIGVEKGGCAGLQYAMRIAQPEPTDHLFTEGGVTLIVDNDSLAFLDGSTIDYIDALNDSGFRVINPNATRSCGCGTSFEPKESA
ncbi:iron-sulfur cluster assembly accessory protein [Prosthecobacter algae]|jgi:iron-sulfur cluster assembly accessory protein|uniref:Iron-sulfur cluster assembly accessory protein n=1 Tax=Prosthecobacter algae TaxID=1144682 RepID=A0ABP9PDV2_9BACT|nr:iron-sulfur cluster assembly accessory protein [Verrucomicrobiales bacterium]